MAKWQFAAVMEFSSSTPTATKQTREALEGSPPLVLTPTQYNITGYTNIGGGGLLFPLAVTSIPGKAIWPYVQQWNLDVQREIGWKTTLSVAYVGSKGTHLTTQRDINQLQPLPGSQNPFTPGEPLSADICNSGMVNWRHGNAARRRSICP